MSSPRFPRAWRAFPITLVRRTVMKGHDTQPIYHGFLPRLEMLNQATSRVKDLNDDVNTPFSFAVTANRSRFGYLFPELQVPEALLPERAETKEALVRLGMSMR